MTILVREEEKKDYRRVEEITRQAFSYPGRIERGGIGCPYEHWMVNELRRRDGILPLSLVAAEQFGVADAEGYNYPLFMGMELIPGYLKEANGGRFFESDIYNDELNREQVRRFDEQFSREE